MGGRQLEVVGMGGCQLGGVRGGTQLASERMEWKGGLQLGE